MVEFYRRDAESRLGSVCALQIVSNQVISAYLTKHFTLQRYVGNLEAACNPLGKNPRSDVADQSVLLAAPLVTR